jgi:DNA-binding IclR family transcriptional regulator
VINSVLKAIDILQAFRTDEPRLSLAEISTRLDMPRSTTHNLLNTLLSRGFVEKTDDGRYALGPAIVALTQSVRVNVELRDRAAPLLRELADACRESVYLTTLENDYALYIYAVESPRRLLARTAVGDRVLLHCISLGKAILSRLSSEEVEGIVNRVGLPKFTETTITDLDALKAELEQIRAQGYAVDREEHETGTYCIGVPILDSRGQAVGACSVSSLDPELISGDPPECAVRVMHTAQEISRRMGYVPARPSSVVTS